MLNKSFLLIAQRYLFTKHKDSTIQSMIKVCFLGITLATCSLALVISVMEGFEYATHQKMQSIYPDFILDTNNQPVDMDLLCPILQEQQYGIASFSPQRTAQALLYNDEYSTTPTVICLKGIDPNQEAEVSSLYTKATSPKSSKKFSHIIHDNHIFIGTKLAQNLGVSSGDEIQLLYSNDELEKLQVTFQQKPVIIGGIFKTGVDEFDTNFVYCSTNFFDNMFPDHGVRQVYLKADRHSFAQNGALQLKERLNVDIYSWQELYPALVSALKLEKYAMFFILLLIVIIASMNIISLIFMYITQKNKEIALLICFGMSLRKIKILFIFISLSIATLATSLGLLIAYTIGTLLQIFPFITLPDDAYLLTHLPIKLDPVLFCVIFISSIMITLFASMISTRKINSINIVQALKYE